MYILGMSGLHQSVEFKRREFPHLEERDYVNVHGADAAAALVGPSGIIAACAEERFNRKKASAEFPIHAIRYCLREGGVSLSDVDCVAHGFDYEPFSRLHQLPGMKKRFDEVFAKEVHLAALAKAFPQFSPSRYVPIAHHLAHAASAFYCSGFEDSLILVADGMGEAHNTTLALGTRGGIRVLHQNGGLHSLGFLYGVFTLHLGFMMGMDEYKVMGLAPYGDPQRFQSIVEKLIQFRPDTGFSIPLLYSNKTAEEAETNQGILRRMQEMFGPARVPESPLEQIHMDLAAAIQNVLQQSLLRILRHWQQQTGAKRLCLAGGVSLNCTANGEILRSGLFDSVFVQPAAGDDGTALGAALHVLHDRAPTTRLGRIALPLWGPGFSTHAVTQALEGRAGLEIRAYEREEEQLSVVADALARARTVAWFQGRMEYGPRALGSRSILADPRNPEMRERINRLVKKREEFRPFAPIVKSEAAGRYFDIAPGQESTFAHMLFVTFVKPEYRTALPAVTHVNGTARVQTLERAHNERLWGLLDAFEKRTGLPILLNTSFNVRGQPIVCTPTEAVETFLAHDLDLLVMENLVVRAS